MKRLLLTALLLLTAATVNAQTFSERNKALVRPHLDKIRRVVFTKHHNQAGSHYAYTEKLYDHLFKDKWRDAGFVPGGV